MTDTLTELDFSVLEALDFPIPCAIPGHGTSVSCDNGPAVWIAEKKHACDPKVLPICDRFKRVMEEIPADEIVMASSCGHLMPYHENFKVIDKL